MEIIKRKDGSVRYREKVYLKGKAYTKSFKRKADALAWKRQVLSERDRNAVLGVELNDQITLIELANEWMSSNSPSWQPRTIKQYMNVLNNHVLPNIGEKKLQSLQLSDGRQILNMVRHRLSPSRTELIVRVLKQVLKAAVDWEYILRSPFASLKAPSIPPTQIKYWQEEEINRFLLLNKDCDYYPVWYFTLKTGLRKGEVCGLCWDKVFLDRPSVTIARVRDQYGLKNTTKTHEIRTIPITKSCVQVLKSLQSKKTSKYVFLDGESRPISYEHLGDRHFKRAIRKANVTPIQFKDLRSTFASWFVMSGGDVFALSKLLGHKGVEMTAKKYAALHPDYLKNALEILDNRCSPQIVHDG